MPAECRVDAEQGVVFTTVWGAFSVEDVLTAREYLRQNPEFSPDLKQLVDMRGVTEMMPSDRVKDLALSDPFGAGARRAFLAPTGLAFGTMRMYQVFTENPEIEMKVCRDLDEACEWLGITHPEQEGIG